MGSYDNIVKIEEMRKKVEEGDLLSAKQILDTMDIKKVKNISDLNLMAEVLKENEQYDEAAEFYLKIYEKLQTRKTIYNLVDISIKRCNTEEAEEYLKQYLKISPDDFDGHIFRYKLDKIKGASYEQQIQILEALNKIEYTEKWEYELAKLYYKAGMEEECIRECSNLILLFGEGTYVEKAKMLRSYYSGETNKEKIMEELRRRAGEAEGSEDNNESNAEAEGSDDNNEVYEGAESPDDNNEAYAEAEGSDSNEVYAEGFDYDEANVEVKDVEDNIEGNLESGVSNDNRERATADIQNAQPEEVTLSEPLEQEEDIYSGSDFMMEHETEEFEFSLKNDVREMLTDEVYIEDMEEELTEENEAIEESMEEAAVAVEKNNILYDETEAVIARTEAVITETEAVTDETAELEDSDAVNDEIEEILEETAAMLEKSKVLNEELKASTQEKVTELREIDIEEALLSTEEETSESKQQSEEQNSEDTTNQTMEAIMDEDDLKLMQIAEELQINPEEVFGNFLAIQSIKKQLVKSLESILQKNEKSGFLLITGTDKEEKTNLAKNLALFMSKVGKISSFAKINSEKLNTVDIMMKKETLRSCCVVIENASGLKRETIDKLFELFDYLNGDIAVVFDEEKKNINKLFKESPKLMNLLNIIHLPQYNQDDLMSFAFACLKQKAYKLDPKAETHLQIKVNQIAKQSEPHRYLEQIYDLIQSVMDAADKRYGKQLSNKKKGVESLTIQPEDFKA